MARTSFAVVGKTFYQITASYDFRGGAKIKSCRIRLLISPVIYSATTLRYPIGFSFIHFVDFLPLVPIGKGYYFSFYTSTYLRLLSLHMQNVISQVNHMPTLRQVCSIILLQIMHLQLHVKLSFHL